MIMERICKTTRRLIPVLFALLILGGCIKNDIPVARIPVKFTDLTVSGQDAGTTIDSTNMVATVALPEQVDIYNVVFDKYTIYPADAEIVDNPFNMPVDLSTPLHVTLRLYQDWDWTIRAVQNIERYFEIAGQMGSTAIDTEQRTVTVTVLNTADIAKLRVVKAKLGPIGSTMTPDLAEGFTFDGSEPLEVKVTAYGRNETWTINVNIETAAVTTTGVDAWTCVAWAYGSAEAGKDNGFQYRLAGDTEWLSVPQTDISNDGGSFTGLIKNLDALTDYEVRAYSGEQYGETLSFTTGMAVQVPNSDFDHWWLNGKVWCPWAEDGTPYWDTGNRGATTLGQSNSVPTTDTPTGSGWAAELETRFVGISVLGKLAAGNLFVGEYVRTDGTNGVLSMGRQFTERPTALKGMFKYHMEPINYSNTEMKSLIGQPDTCTVWIALIDSDEPCEIRTNPKDRKLFDPEADDVVAFGRMDRGESVEEWTPFEVKFEYRSYSRKPKYILITCSASKYGDYFTGGAGSVMYVDDFELLYNYQ